MKEISNISRGLNFGINAVNAGQRNTAIEPQIIVVSTLGSFRLTPAVTKFLQLQHGDYVAFANNLDNIDMAIINRDPAILDFCAEKGFDVDSPEASLAIHAEFDTWLIYKGVREYDSKGTPKTMQERLTKADRVKVVKAYFDNMLQAALSSDNEELVVALSREDITKEEQIELLTPFVEAKELPKYQGSKLANSNSMSGFGTTLNFTDTNVWSQLKSDLGSNAEKVNRTYDISLKSVEEGGNTTRISVYNGYENVEVPAIVLGGYSDSKPTARVSTKKAETEAAEIAE